MRLKHSREPVQATTSDFFYKRGLAFFPMGHYCSAHHVSTFGTSARVAELVDALD